MFKKVLYKQETTFPAPKVIHEVIVIVSVKKCKSRVENKRGPAIKMTRKRTPQKYSKCFIT